MTVDLEVGRCYQFRFRRDGEWIIIELGDGQVAGLPEAANVHAFYAALNDHWPAPP